MIINIKNMEVCGKHKDKSYIVYFKGISEDNLNFIFNKRWELEEFLYSNGIEKFTYYSSNGNALTKIWEYIPEKLDSWKNNCSRTNKEKQQGMPTKYSLEDYLCGHFVKNIRRYNAVDENDK